MIGLIDLDTFILINPLDKSSESKNGYYNRSCCLTFPSPAGAKLNWIVLSRVISSML